MQRKENNEKIVWSLLTAPRSTGGGGGGGECKQMISQPHRDNEQDAAVAHAAYPSRHAGRSEPLLMKLPDRSPVCPATSAVQTLHHPKHTLEVPISPAFKEFGLAMNAP